MRARYAIPSIRSHHLALALLLACSACGDESPLAVLEADLYQGLAPLVVRFDARQSSGPPERPLTYAWDFGDGDQATEVSPLHTFRGGGIFQVTLTVTASDLATRRLGVGGTVVQEERGRADTAQAIVAVTPWGHEVLRLTNRERAANGVDNPLAHNALLVAAGVRHNDDMAANHFFSHTGSDGSSPFDRMEDEGFSFTTAAENIAAGQRSPAEVVEAWMDSPGHRANILTAALRELGVAYGYYPGSDYGHYWTQDFGTQPDYWPLVINGEAWATADPQVQLHVYGCEWADEMAVVAAPATVGPQPGPAAYPGTPAADAWGPCLTEAGFLLPDQPGYYTLWVTLRGAHRSTTAADSIALVAR